MIDSKDQLIFRAKVALTDIVSYAIDNFSFAKRYALATANPDREREIVSRVSENTYPNSSLELERHTNRPITIEQLITASVWNELNHLPASRRYITATMLEQLWNHATPTNRRGTYSLRRSDLTDTMTDIFAAYFNFEQTLADSIIDELTAIPGISVTQQEDKSLTIDKHRLMDTAEDYDVPERVNLSAINAITLASVCRRIQTEYGSTAIGDWIELTEAEFTEYTESEIAATVTEPSSVVEQHEADIVGLERHRTEGDNKIRIHVDEPIALDETATWALDSLPGITANVFTRAATRSLDEPPAEDTEEDSSSADKDNKTTGTVTEIDAYE